MEDWLSLQNILEYAEAGDEVLGELVISNKEILTNITIELSILCRENVNFRSLDNGTTACSDKIASQKSKHAESVIKYNELNNEGHSVKFILKLPKNLQPTCYVEGLGDVAYVEYNVRARLQSEGKTLAKASSFITILPCATGIPSLEHIVNFRGCCLNYGSLNIVTMCPKLSWRLNEIINIELSLNNSKSSVKILNISFELWKHIKLRDKHNNFESCSTLIHRGSEQVNFAYGESLTAEGVVNVRINLNNCSDKLEKHVTSIGELLCCEYVVKFLLSGKALCGTLEAGFSRPLVIRH